jgi:hypothetical protein
MAACGAVPKWQPGWLSVSDDRWTLAEAGITCSGWAEARACHVHSTRRATKLHSRLLKKLPEEVEKLHQAYPEASIELWSQDEHRIGLKPILRRVWARKGTRVRAVVRPRYQWMYLYGFVEPQSGKTSWLLMPTVNTAAFSLALAAFAQEQGVGPDKHLLLVAGPSLAGTRVLISSFLKGCTCCSCRLIRRSSNQQNAYGPSQTNRSPTGS